MDHKTISKRPERHDQAEATTREAPPSSSRILAKGDTLEESATSGRRDLVSLRPHLFVVLECDRPTSGGARHALSGVSEVVIGRGEERRVSRRTSGGEA